MVTKRDEELKDDFEESTVQVGRMNALAVVRQIDAGLILNGGELGDILLPNRYTPDECWEGDVLDVFVMLDSEDRLVAVSDRPYAMVDEFAYLKVAAVTKVGAFLDWGMPKDLLVPFREQKTKLSEGEWCIVRIYLDEVSGRLAASTKLDRYLDKEPPRYEADDEVDLMICAKTDLGFKAIVDGLHWGVIFHNEVFQRLDRGEQLKGYIKQVRPDGKIDLCLRKPGGKTLKGVAQDILDYMAAQEDGFMPITDKSPPREIYRLFGVSKKQYKRVIGGLYKERLILVEPEGTRLVRGKNDAAADS